MRKEWVLGVLVVASGVLLASCNKSSTSSPSYDAFSSFSYPTVSWTPTLGAKTNDESHDYSSLIVNPTEGKLRSDFAYGVDASMIQKVEDLGGVYYNQDGKEQDVYQILSASGVNFFRLRLWNSPSDKYGRSYGGGENDVKQDIKMAKRAVAAGMNICLDFHYSDFWADPDHQILPKAWMSANKEDIPNLLETFTKDTLQQFKEAGIDVAAVQVGNEINNGMAGTYGAIDWNSLDSSFAYVSSLLKAGIAGTKSVFPHAATIIHLSSGANKEEYATYFKQLAANDVQYDIIGASYYPHLHGALSKLQANLNAITAQTGKPVMIMETSWGFTNEFVDGVTANEYDATDEDTGGYLTSEQAQATCVRDVVNVLSNVPDSKGLGCFYWEPAWLPVSKVVDGKTEVSSWASARGQSYLYNGDDKHASSYTDGLATWCNQGWFSYTGKALASAAVYKDIKSGGLNATTEKSTAARKTAYVAEINLAASETLPTTGKVVTNLNAIRDASVTWDATQAAQCTKVGTYTVNGVLDGQYNIILTAKCIQNYVVDPGFENQGETDILKDPWFIRNQDPADEKVVKLDRKSDTRSGETDLNWYHSSKDFSFNVYQTIRRLPAGTYDLQTYLMAEKNATYQTKSLVFYLKTSSAEYTVDATDKCIGWSSGYQTIAIANITIAETMDVEIGIRCSASARAWAHNDDWSLVKA